MGMSASQSRFLMLTGQKNDNEFQAQSISYQRLMLSQQTDAAAVEYADKTNNRTLLFSGFDKDGKKTENTLTYTNITQDLNMTLINAASGKIMVPVLPEKFPEGKTADDYFVDDNLNDAKLLEMNLRDGNYIMQREENGEMKNVALAGATGIIDSLDDLDDSAAEGEYSKQKEQFQSIDKKFELKLKQLESEHKAIETEIDSVSKVIQKNVETTFKTFG